MRKYGKVMGMIPVLMAAALGGCVGSVGGESCVLSQQRAISEEIGRFQTGAESLAAENDKADYGEATKGSDKEAGSEAEYREISEEADDKAVSNEMDNNAAVMDVPAWETVKVPEFSRELPRTGFTLSDFVMEGWVLLDSAELDFNEDGITDYVGVLEVLRDEDWEDPGLYFDFYNLRILFAIASDGPGQYRLDFQDENLIPIRAEGGSYGDPYLPPTAQGISFTTHEYGGSAWRDSEDCTYTYKDGEWYLALSVKCDGYGDYITSYSRDDWDSGIGIRKKRSTEWEEMKKHWDDWYGWQDQGEYDLVYEIALDEPPTLYQAGKRRPLSTCRVTDWEVEELILAEGVELAKELVELPDNRFRLDYCDENCVIYTFYNRDSKKDYLALYRWPGKSLEVLAEAECYFTDIELYQNKIYFSMEIVEDIAYKSSQGGEECIEEKKDTVGMRLNRMNMDGTGMETIFEYRYPGTDRQILEDKPPYLGLYYTISGGEIVATVYNGGGDGTHLVYRMNADGSGQHRIGQIPKE